MVEKGKSGPPPGYRRTIRLDLTPREHLELALWLEKSGLEFYRLLSEESKEGRLRDFFLRLAGMEMAHEKIIRDLMISLAPQEPVKLPFDETLSRREFFLHLRSLTEKDVFPHDFRFLAQLEQFKEPKDALPAALQIEEKAIHLYRTLSEFKLSVQAHGVLQRLVHEEEKHAAEIKAILKSVG